MKSASVILIFALLAVMVFGSEAVGQCAMCKATLEANSANSSKYGVGLNTGILYLMTIPYLAAAVVGYLWYKNAKVKKARPLF